MRAMGKNDGLQSPQGGDGGGVGGGGVNRRKDRW